MKELMFFSQFQLFNLILCCIQINIFLAPFRLNGFLSITNGNVVSILFVVGLNYFAILIPQQIREALDLVRVK